MSLPEDVTADPYAAMRLRLAQLATADEPPLSVLRAAQAAIESGQIMSTGDDWYYVVPDVLVPLVNAELAYAGVLVPNRVKRLTRVDGRWVQVLIHAEKVLADADGIEP